MRKAIFLLKGLEERVLPTLHKQYFEEMNIDCEYWATKFLSRHSNTVTREPNGFGDIKIRAVTKDMLTKELSELKDTVFIISYAMEQKNRHFYQLLKRYNIPYIVIVNRVSSLHIKNRGRNRQFIKNGFIKSLVPKYYTPLVRLFNNLTLDISAPKLAIIGTSNNYIAYNYPVPKSGFTKFHNENYEILLHQNSNIETHNQLVFIDQYLPWHVDTADFSKWSMKPETYYPKISALLLKLGQILDMRPVIATHPKAKEGLIEPLVQGIEVRYGETTKLIAESAIAIQHSSLTIEQSVMLNKPFILVSCSEIHHSPIQSAIEVLSEEFKKPVLHAED
ncbi:MAG: hypothetical protein ACK5XN_36820, partial [Bacteroidota bacterium]